MTRAQNPARYKPDSLSNLDKGGAVDPIEMEWKRKDRTPLRVRLSGQEVTSEQSEPSAYELIAEDVTKQRGVGESPTPTKQPANR